MRQSPAFVLSFARPSRYPSLLWLNADAGPASTCPAAAMTWTAPSVRSPGPPG